MANFGSNFLKNFSPNFANTFDTSFRSGLNKQEEERQRREREKAQLEQQGILQQLISGQKPTYNYAGMNSPLLQTNVPMTGQDKFNSYSQLSPTNQNAYEYWQRENAPDYNSPILQKDNKTILRWNNKTGKLEDTGQSNPLYKEDIPTTFEVVQANTVKGYEKYPNDYTVQVKKKGDEIIDVTTPNTFKQRSININTGEEYNKLDTNTKSFLDGKVTELNQLRGLLTHSPDDNNKYRIYDKLGQDTGIRYTKEQVQKAIDDKNAELDNYLRSNGGTAISDFEETKKRASNDPKLQGKPNSQQASVWNKVYQDYIKDLSDEKDDAWLETQKYAFIKDYGVDPVMKFHQGLFKRKK